MTSPHDTPTPRPADSPGLPAEALARGKRLGRYPGRHTPRVGDLALTGLFSVVLYFLAVVYVTHAISRADAASQTGPVLANILAVAAPIVLSVFSTAFCILFLLRRVWAFWLPVVAAILIVALYSITQQMLDTAAVSA